MIFSIAEVCQFQYFSLFFELLRKISIFATGKRIKEKLFKDIQEEHNMETKRWLAFANRKRCNHAQALSELGFINWTMNHVSFNIGDIVYLFLSDEKRVRFKTVVVAKNCRREDCKYWVEPAPNDTTFKLDLISEYYGTELNDSELKKYGFKGGGSIEKPMYSNTQLFDYIDEVFQNQKYGWIIKNQCKTPKTIENVRKTIPILIYWAQQGRSNIPYIEIAKELGYSWALPMGGILGAIHDVLTALSHTTGNDIPSLNALVISMNEKRPSDGFSYVRPDYKTLTPTEKKNIASLYNQKAFDFGGWDWVLSALELPPFHPNSTNKELGKKNKRYWGNGGEGMDHKLMKEYISIHPELLNIGNIDKNKNAILEYTLLSADRIDILFEQNNGNRIAVEVKPQKAPDEDILRGIYQCVKYKSLLDAEDIVHNRNKKNSCILVVGGKLSQENKATASILGINVVEEFSYT